MAAGWQNDGTFVRANPDFEGNDVWQQDQQVPYKIIASRHDIHDNVLSTGIEACLNLDGVNEMRAALRMGDFKITGVANGTNNGDGVAWNQIINDVSFDNGTRNLTLARADGDFVVNIPDSGGGGGSGTVNWVIGGEGIDVTPSSQSSTSYTVELDSIGTGNTVSGGIESITWDEYGRVTQVVQGTQGVTNLSIGTREITRFLLESSSGNDVWIPPASETEAGLIRGNEWEKLSNLPDPAGGFGYEEGTWTPGLQSGALTLGGGTTGRFTRIGNVVYFNCYIEWTNNATPDSSEVYFNGLPYNIQEVWPNSGDDWELNGSNAQAVPIGNYQGGLDVNGIMTSNPGLANDLFAQTMLVEGRPFSKRFAVVVRYGRDADSSLRNSSPVVLISDSYANTGNIAINGWYFTDSPFA